jgi:hypothetical protein
LEKSANPKDQGSFDFHDANDNRSQENLKRAWHTAVKAVAGGVNVVTMAAITLAIN